MIIENKLLELKRGLVFKNSNKIAGKKYLDWIESKFDDLSNLINLMKITIEEEIPTAWGKPGEPGDNLKIKKAIDKLIDACNHLYDVEVDILFTKPHQCFYKLKETLQGITFNIFEELKRIHEDIHKIFCQSNPVGEYKIIIKFDLPSNINDFMKEVERLKNNPQEWINIFLKKF